VTRIGIILGSTRPNRNGEQVAHSVLEVASRRHDAYFELLDLRDYPLPHLDEPLPPSLGEYQNEHTRQWAAMADVRQQVTLSLMTEFENFSVFKPGDYNLPALNTMLDQVVAWSTALAPLRETAGPAA
jgi:hypothetical protein